MPSVEQEKAEEATHRLHDIRVEEVSVVDRAANKRRFLLVKKDEAVATQTEIKPTANGTFTAKDEPDPDTEAEATEEAAAEEAAPAEEAAEAAPAEEAVPEAASDADTPSAPTDAEKADDFAQLKALAGSIKAELEAGPGEVEKRLPASKLARLFSLLKEVDALIEGQASPADSTPAPTKTRKAADPALAELSARVDELTGIVGQLTKVNKSQAAEIAKLRSVPGESNAVDVEKSAAKAAQPLSWPRDMNRPINRDTVRKDRWLGQ